MLHANLECRACGVGLLEFNVRNDTGELYLECDECSTGFRGIVDGRLGDSFIALFVNGKIEWTVRPATLDEVVGAGLEWAIR